MSLLSSKDVSVTFSLLTWTSKSTIVSGVSEMFALSTSARLESIRRNIMEIQTMFH